MRILSFFVSFMLAKFLSCPQYYKVLVDLIRLLTSPCLRTTNDLPTKDFTLSTLSSFFEWIAKTFSADLTQPKPGLGFISYLISKIGMSLTVGPSGKTSDFYPHPPQFMIPNGQPWVCLAYQVSHPHLDGQTNVAFFNKPWLGQKIERFFPTQIFEMLNTHSFMFGRCRRRKWTSTRAWPFLLRAHM